MQRPAVRDEDLAEAKTKLGGSGTVKSKTFEVMEECGENINLYLHKFMGVLHDTRFEIDSRKPVSLPYLVKLRSENA